MKKILASIFVLFLFIGNAEAGRNGIQFGSTGNVNLIHYGDNYGWAAGLSLGYDELDYEVENASGNLLGESEMDMFEVGIFARKNFKLQEKTYAGLGLWAQWGMGNDTDTYIGQEGKMIAIETDIDVFSISPYLLVEYHLTNNLFLSAGAEIVRFKETTYADDTGETEKDELSFFEPFISLAYVF